MYERKDSSERSERNHRRTERGRGKVVRKEVWKGSRKRLDWADAVEEDLTGKVRIT